MLSSNKTAIDQQPINDQKTEDYKEGAMKTAGEIYFGSRSSLKLYYNDINKLNNNSKYFGCVLYPENSHRQNQGWSYEKNMDFWKGGIETAREFVLINPITGYPNQNNEVSGTISEILWLIEAGYTYLPDSNDPKKIRFIPPAQVNNLVSITDFRQESETDILKKFDLVKRDIIKIQQQQPSQLIAKTSLGNKPNQYSRNKQQSSYPFFFTSNRNRQDENKIDINKTNIPSTANSWRSAKKY